MTQTILVVDDEYDLQQVVRGILEDEGYNVVACSSGREALATIEQTHPHLVLLDVMMPVMSGYEVLDRLGPQTGDVPIVLMSAAGPRPDDGAEPRMCAFLKKPFQLEKLLTTVRRFARGE
jgi:CheY-like chemotaxis protein